MQTKTSTSKRIKPYVIALFASVVTILFACGGSGTSAVAVSTAQNTGWQQESNNPLIVPTFSIATMDWGPTDPSLLFDTDDNKWKIWYASVIKDRTSGNETMTIKYAESTDGVQWSVPQIAFQIASDITAWDHTHTETPSVIKNPIATDPDKKYMLWYSGANIDNAPGENRPDTFPYYQIGLAYSADGTAFTRVTPGLHNKAGLVLEADASIFGSSLPGTFGDGVVADPEVIVKDGQMHMWFSSYAESVPSPISTSGRIPLAFGISHMTSTDGVTWTASHDNPLASLAKNGDVVGGQQPSVVFNSTSNQYEMWFSNDTDAEKAMIPCHFNTVNGFYHATSNDGITWMPDYSDYDLAYDTNKAYESLGFLTGVEALIVNNVYYMYYVAWGTEQNPDSSVYLCPGQTAGSLHSAALALNRVSDSNL